MGTIWAKGRDLLNVPRRAEQPKGWKHNKQKVHRSVCFSACLQGLKQLPAHCGSQAEEIVTSCCTNP